MVQILPPVPTFLDRLGPAFQFAGQSIGQAVQKKKEDQILNSVTGVLNDPNATPLQKVNAFSRLPEQYKKGAAPLWAAILGPEAQAQSDRSAFEQFQQSQGNFANQFSTAGTFPQQPTDIQSIEPSTSTPPSSQNLKPGQVQQSQGLSLGNETGAEPGLSGTGGIGSEMDVSPQREKFLIKEASFQNNKNPYISAKGKEAQGELDRLREDRKERRESHKESATYDEEILKSAKRARQQLDALKDISDTLATGKIKPGSVTNVFRNLGEVGNKISDAFKSGEHGKFEAAIPQLLEGWKEVFGVRLSDADLRLLQTKLPDIGKSPEANKAIVDLISKYAKAPLMRAEIASSIKKKNGGYRPLNFPDIVEQELQRRQYENEEVRVRAPDGSIRLIPRNMLEGALQAQGQLIQ